MEKQIKLIATTLRDIDFNMWKEFKMLCLKNDISANQKIKDLIAEYVNKKDSDA